MMSPDFKPILRQVDLIPGTIEGQPFLFLRDPVGFVDELLPIPQQAAFLLSYMDGDHDLRDLQVLATKGFAQIVPLEEIIKFVEVLDEKGYLWSPNFEKIKEKVYEEWMALPARPMAHANQAYPLEPVEAKDFVEAILGLEGEPSKELTPRVLIVPHIDLRPGARCYASSYRRFNVPSGSRVIILGVGHYLDYPFSVLAKDLYTPFGLLRYDRGGFFYLNNSRGIELFPNHIAHRREHSIEFQTLFLHYLKGDELVILPFLLSAPNLLKDAAELTENLIDGLVELIDDRTYLILGIDFCHLGLRYGDPQPAGEEVISLALEFDRRVIELTFAAEVDLLEDELTQKPWFKCCGAGCLYLLAKLLAKLKSKTQGMIYRQEALPFGEGSIVTIASAGLFLS